MSKAGRRFKQYNEHGFTIVELMIALSVLSVLLITATLVLIQIGALYSKGVNAADLQNANRTLVADISAQLQFSGRVPNGCQMNTAATSPLAPTIVNTTCFSSSHNYSNTNDGTTETVYSYCINNTRYSYVMNRELGTDTTTTPQQTTPHVLWRDTLTTNATACPTPDITQPHPADGSTQPGSGYEMLGNHMRLTRFVVQQTTTSSGIYNVDAWMAFGDSDLVQPDPSGSPGRSLCNGGRGTQFCSVSAISTQLTGRIY